MDTAPCQGAEELADGVDLLVAESTFSDDDGGLARQYRHLTAGQAGELAAGAGARTLVLTHFSSRYGDDTEPLAVQARARAAHTSVIAAQDLQRVPLPQRRAWPGDRGTAPERSTAPEARYLSSHGGQPPDHGDRVSP
jgi:ribonuclease Z